eukprot:SAG31_NODE_1587_length_7819_cov_3.703277_6_plen_85_part_00
MYKYNVLDILYYIINGPAHNDVVLVLLFKVLESTINLRGTRSAGTSDKSRFRIFQRVIGYIIVTSIPEYIDIVLDMYVYAYNML